MPKIVINEWDKTKAGETEYSNFTVVVPGFVASDKIKPLNPVAGNSYFEDVADENGIFECSSPADFIEYVGKVKATTASAAEGAQYTRKFEITTTTLQITSGGSEGHEYEYTANVAKETLTGYGLIKIQNAEANIVSLADGASATQCIITVDESLGSITTATDALAVKANNLTAEEYYWTYRNHLYTRTTAPAETDPGYLVGYDNGVLYCYSPVDPQQYPNPYISYYYIEADKEGKNAVEALEQNGNQIAYELLKMGYTILYKQITAASQLANPLFWECLKDRSAYDFRYIITGGYYDEVAYEVITNLATFVNVRNIETADLASQGRGDCIALVDIIETSQDITEATTQSTLLRAIKGQVAAWTWANKYTAIFCPKVSYVMPEDADYDNNTQFPASFHYLACAQKAFIENGYSEWYAVAGFNRGIGPYTVAKTTLGKFGEVAVNNLEPRFAEHLAPLTPSEDPSSFNHAINVVAKIRNNYYLWGNRTAHALEVYDPAVDCGLRASHFLNIRQLCCTLKKELYITCRKFTFSPNSDLLWTNFCNTIRPVLEKMKADQGIADYKLIKVVTRTKALLKAKIRIVPIEAVEDFELNISLEDSISGVVVGVDE